MNRKWNWLKLLSVVILTASFARESRAEVAPSAPSSTDAPAKSADGESRIKDLRRAALERPRRLLFNDDGGGPIRRMTEPTVENMLLTSCGYLADTRVNTLMYCTKATGLDLFTHRTKIGTLFTRRDGGYDNNQVGALHEKGIDPLRVAIDFSKQHGLEFFWSIRMNDTHDGSASEYGPVNLSANRFKTAHPEFMLGTKKNRPKYGAFTALDFGRPEVREHAFRIIEEVCRNYDIDGLELDFFRHPVYFQSVARGDKASDEDRDAITELVRRIRAMTEEVGQSRGRPILVALRGQDSVDYAHDIGLDLERWLAEGLVDIYVPGSYFQLNEWDYSVALGHKYHVKVYPSLDDSRMKDAAGLAQRVTKLVYRARAAQVWQSGADGVYLFNYPNQFEHDAAMYRELADPTELATLDKDYFGSIRGFGRAAGGNLPFEPYLHVETLSPDHPKTIKPGKMATAKILWAEDPKQSASARLTLLLKLPGADAGRHIQVSLNGRPLAAKPGMADWLKCSPAPSELRSGLNTIGARLAPEAKEPATWSDVVLEVRYPTKK